MSRIKLKQSVWSKMLRQKEKMKLNLNIKYKQLPKDNAGSDTKSSDLTKIVLTRLVDTEYANGKMPHEASRLWAKILDEFSDDKDSIEIDGSQFDWLKGVVDKTDLPPGFSSWLWTVRSYFDELKINSKKKEELKAV